jgi:hypothetical protein
MRMAIRLHVRKRMLGHALAETIVALLALMPFLLGVPLLGKQLDIKHKTFDAARYSAWERTVWRSDGAHNVKNPEDIALEMRDRVFGDPRVVLLDVSDLHARGITENRLWTDQRRERLLDHDRSAGAVAFDADQRPAPVEVGHFLVPGLAYGTGPVASGAQILGVADLDFDRRAFATAQVTVSVRPVLAELAAHAPSLGRRDRERPQPNPLVHEVKGGILSDTWAPAAEAEFRRRVDYVTTDELVETLEQPGRVFGALALGRGRPLYGEGQYAWDPVLQPSSRDVPSRYLERR